MSVTFSIQQEYTAWIHACACGATVSADAGVPAVREGNFIDCGRHEGYMDERFEQLSDLAGWAAANNAKVVWS